MRGDKLMELSDAIVVRIKQLMKEQRAQKNFLKEYMTFQMITNKKKKNHMKKYLRKNGQRKGPGGMPGK